MEGIPRHQLEPSFCPLHSSKAPCLYCLSPEVAELVSIYHKEDDKANGFLFIQPDLNQN